MNIRVDSWLSFLYSLQPRDQKRTAAIPVGIAADSILSRLLVSRILFRFCRREPAGPGRSFLFGVCCQPPPADCSAVRPTRGSSGSFDPACRPGPGLSAYLVLLPMGFAVPRVSPPARCALTAPFHPYLRKGRMQNDEGRMKRAGRHFWLILHSAI